jgi:hypothetical protein
VSKKRGGDASRVIPFRDEDMVYDANEFLFPDHDERGLQAKINFRTSPLMERAL